jgi:hypothetical protein
MPQTSSSGISHRHVATAFHFVILTFISLAAEEYAHATWAGSRCSGVLSSVELRETAEFKSRWPPACGHGTGVKDAKDREQQADQLIAALIDGGPSSPNFFSCSCCPLPTCNAVRDPDLNWAPAARIWTKQVNIDSNPHIEVWLLRYCLRPALSVHASIRP